MNASFLTLFLPKRPRFQVKYTFDQPRFQAIANLNRFILRKRVSATQISLYPSDAVIESYLASWGEKQDSQLKLLGVKRNWVKIQPWPSVFLVLRLPWFGFKFYLWSHHSEACKTIQYKCRLCHFFLVELSVANQVIESRKVRILTFWRLH